MRVGLNATCFSDQPSGANQRFRLLYGALIRRNPAITFVVFEPADFRVSGWFEGLSNVETVVTPLPAEGRFRRLLAGLGYWRQALRRARLDLFEAFHLPAAIAPDCPTLLTIHDLRPLRPEAGWLERLIARPILHRALANSAGTIAVSEVVAEEIRALHPGARVETVANGVDTRSIRALTEDQAGEIAAELGLPAQYTLAVGHLEERKNLAQLVKAIAALRQAGLERPLILAGNDRGDRGKLERVIADLELGDLVRIIPGLDDRQIAALYHRCSVFAFPSRYEGFGIPLIEAMVAGKPIVASDTAVFREVAGKAALFFPLDDISATAQAIETAWSDPGERERLISAGADRIQTFDFDVLADRLAGIYRSIASNRASAAAGE